jgi:hypothetical protein
MGIQGRSEAALPEGLNPARAIADTKRMMAELEVVTRMGAKCASGCSSLVTSMPSSQK